MTDRPSLPENAEMFFVGPEAYCLCSWPPDEGVLEVSNWDPTRSEMPRLDNTWLDASLAPTPTYQDLPWIVPSVTTSWSTRAGTMLEHDTFAHELEAPLLTDTDHGALEIVAPRERMQRAQRTQVSHALILLVCALVVLVSVTLWTQPGSTGHDRQVSLCTEQAKRREWRSLTTLEKQEYIDAVLCLRTQKSILHPRQSRYDDFPYIHAHVGNATHDTAGFLPWHRYFVHVYETALRKECNYTGVMTYWDWTLDWADFRNAPIWDPSIGFGGDGGKHAPQSVGQGRCVTDGPFAGLEALYNNRRLESHCLSRGFPGPSEMKRWTNGLQPRLVEEVMALEDYQDFYLELENGPHLAIPYSVRGDFYSFSAPYGKCAQL